MSPAKIICVAVALASFAPSLTGSALAQTTPGDLDTTFGVSGTVITPISGFSDQANALVVQPDGKVVAAGVCDTGGTDSDFCLARYLPNGTLDVTFGPGGLVTTAISAGTDEAHALVLQPDGKIVAAGACVSSGTNFNFCLARYDTNGVLDASFGSNGVVSTPVGTSAIGARALVLQPDGKLVAGGSCREATPDAQFCLVRYEADGTVDATFGDGGSVIVEFDDEEDILHALIRLPDGRFVAGGNCGVFGEPDPVFCMAGFDAGGDLDPGFGVVARVMTDITPGFDRAFTLVRQPDGNLVMAGGCETGSQIDFCLARYDALGNLDASFGTGGTVVTDAGGLDDHDGVFGLVLQADGKLVAGGFCDDLTFISFCLARYDTAGNLDAAFGAGGIVTADINPGFDDQAFALALQPDGKLVAAGKCDGSTSSNVCLARYDGDVETVVLRLINRVTSDPTIEDNLAAPLDQTVKILTDHNPENDVEACGQLGAVTNRVNAAEKNRRLTSPQAGELRGLAQDAQRMVACK